MKFTRAGGRVRVACGVANAPAMGARVTGPGPWACVDVEDKGMGIAPERLAEMFEPFRQGQGGLTRVEGGAGLGLTVARHLARLMGGDVTVRSAPGHGSCFTLLLPAAADSVADEAHEARARERVGGAISTAGRELTCCLEDVIEAYVCRIRADPVLAVARDATDMDLKNQAATLVADVAQSMSVLGASSDDGPSLLRDGSRIQRLVTELHAEQRRRLGWSETQLRRDYELLREEVERSIRAHVPPGEGAETAISIAGRLMRQSQRVGVQAYLAASPAAG